MSDTIELTTKYRLVLLDDQDVEVGTVTALNLNPRSVLVVMPLPGEGFLQAFNDKVTAAFAERGLDALVLNWPVQFVRLEQVSE